MFYFLKASVFKYNNIDIYCKFIGEKSAESDASINIFSKIWLYEQSKILNWRVIFIRRFLNMVLF